MSTAVPQEMTSVFRDVEFVTNTEPRVPCVLILDRSGSMSIGNKIGQLNHGLRLYQQELAADELARKRVETAIVEFGPVNVRCPFTIVDSFEPPMLTADNSTPMGAAILHALQLVRQRKLEYKAAGVSYYRPWLFLITDGMPDPGDPWQQAAQEIRAGHDRREFLFHAVGVDDADFSVLSQLAPYGPKRLGDLKFKELFRWLTASLKSVSSSSVGTSVALPPTDGWSMA